MIVKIIPTTTITGVLTYAGKVYATFGEMLNAIGSTFQLGSSVIVPTVDPGSEYANEIELIVDETLPYIIDDNGNCFHEVVAFKENLQTTIPTRI